jgi:hypothetical protein
MHQGDDAISGSSSSGARFATQFRATAVLLTLLINCAPSRGAEPISLALPIACNVGATCFVQSYVDNDPSAKWRDYSCGQQTYNGHDGTDFRLPSMHEQSAGINVLAAAAGTVIATRDGMADISIRDPAATSVKGHECGNGVMIRHSDGWATQYCHMARGSIQVARGQHVETGTPLGHVGLSGNTEFPHLHFNVFTGRAKVDPFAYGAERDSCGRGKTLWNDLARAALAYRRGQVINAGFAAEPVTNEQIELAQAERAKPTTTSSALVAYVRSIGLEAGDVLELSISAPDGNTLIERREKPLDRAKAQWFVMLGRKRGATPWPAGIYTARYKVIRKDKEGFEKTFTVNLGPPQ